MRSSAASDVYKRQIIELAMDQLPFESYGFYAFLEPYLDGYFKVGETEKAKELFEKLKKVYQERLDYRSGLKEAEKVDQMEDVYADLQAYRRVVDILFENQQLDWGTEELGIYSQYVQPFRTYMGDDNADYLLESPLELKMEELKSEEGAILPDSATLDSLQKALQIPDTVLN